MLIIEKYILIIGKSSVDGLDDTAITAEPEYSIDINGKKILK